MLRSQTAAGSPSERRPTFPNAFRLAKLISPGETLLETLARLRETTNMTREATRSDQDASTGDDPMPSPAMARVGALIRQARTERGLSVKELACLAGVSPATVSQVERNMRPAVSFAMADQILCAMELRLNIEIVPLWADIDEAIDQASRQPLAERIKTWPVDFPAYVSILDGLLYLLDGLTSAAVQGVPVIVEEFEIAIPRDDDVLDRFTMLAD